MALPLLKSFIPPDDIPAGEPAPPAFPSLARGFLDEHETTTLVRAEARAAALCGALERFVGIVSELLPGLGEDDLFRAFEQIEAEDMMNRPALSAHLHEAEERRARIAALKNGSLKPRALQLYDREIRILRRALASFDWAKEQMEILRDAVLVRETQEFSARGFWGEDDES
jgi:hypothetical protein